MEVDAPLVAVYDPHDCWIHIRDFVDAYFPAAMDSVPGAAGTPSGHHISVRCARYANLGDVRRFRCGASDMGPISPYVHMFVANVEVWEGRTKLQVEIDKWLAQIRAEPADEQPWGLLLVSLPSAHFHHGLPGALGNAVAAAAKPAHFLKSMFVKGGDMSTLQKFDDHFKVVYPLNTIRFDPAAETIGPALKALAVHSYSPMERALRKRHKQVIDASGAPDWEPEEYWESGQRLATNALRFGLLTEALSHYCQMMEHRRVKAQTAKRPLLRDAKTQVAALCASGTMFSVLPEGMRRFYVDFTQCKRIQSLTYITGCNMLLNLWLGNRTAALQQFDGFLEAVRRHPELTELPEVWSLVDASVAQPTSLVRVAGKRGPGGSLVDSASGSAVLPSQQQQAARQAQAASMNEQQRALQIDARVGVTHFLYSACLAAARLASDPNALKAAPHSFVGGGGGGGGGSSAASETGGKREDVTAATAAGPAPNPSSFLSDDSLAPLTPSFVVTGTTVVSQSSAPQETADAHFSATLQSIRGSLGSGPTRRGRTATTGLPGPPPQASFNQLLNSRLAWQLQRTDDYKIAVGDICIAAADFLADLGALHGYSLGQTSASGTTTTASVASSTTVQNRTLVLFALGSRRRFVEHYLDLVGLAADSFCSAGRTRSENIHLVNYVRVLVSLDPKRAATICRERIVPHFVASEWCMLALHARQLYAQCLRSQGVAVDPREYVSNLVKLIWQTAKVAADRDICHTHWKQLMSFTSFRTPVSTEEVSAPRGDEGKEESNPQEAIPPVTSSAAPAAGALEDVVMDAEGLFSGFCVTVVVSTLTTPNASLPTPDVNSRRSSSPGNGPAVSDPPSLRRGAAVATVDQPLTINFAVRCPPVDVLEGLAVTVVCESKKNWLDESEGVRHYLSLTDFSLSRDASRHMLFGTKAARMCHAGEYRLHSVAFRYGSVVFSTQYRNGWREEFSAMATRGDHNNMSEVGGDGNEDASLAMGSLPRLGSRSGSVSSVVSSVKGPHGGGSVAGGGNPLAAKNIATAAALPVLHTIRGSSEADRQGRAAAAAAASNRGAGGGPDADLLAPPATAASPLRFDSDVIVRVPEQDIGISLQVCPPDDVICFASPVVEATQFIDVTVTIEKPLFLRPSDAPLHPVGCSFSSAPLTGKRHRHHYHNADASSNHLTATYLGADLYEASDIVGRVVIGRVVPDTDSDDEDAVEGANGENDDADDPESVRSLHSSDDLKPRTIAVPIHDLAPSAPSAGALKREGEAGATRSLVGPAGEGHDPPSLSTAAAMPMPKFPDYSNQFRIQNNNCSNRNATNTPAVNFLQPSRLELEGALPPPVAIGVAGGSAITLAMRRSRRTAPGAVAFDIVLEVASDAAKHALLTATTIKARVPLLSEFLAWGAVNVSFCCFRDRDSCSRTIQVPLALTSPVETSYRFQQFRGKVFCNVIIRNRLKDTPLVITRAELCVAGSKANLSGSDSRGDSAPLPNTATPTARTTTSVWFPLLGPSLSTTSLTALPTPVPSKPSRRATLVDVAAVPNSQPPAFTAIATCDLALGAVFRPGDVTGFLYELHRLPQERDEQQATSASGAVLEDSQEESHAVRLVLEYHYGAPSPSPSSTSSTGAATGGNLPPSTGIPSASSPSAESDRKRTDTTLLAPPPASTSTLDSAATFTPFLSRRGSMVGFVFSHPPNTYWAEPAVFVSRHRCLYSALILLDEQQTGSGLEPETFGGMIGDIGRQGSLLSSVSQAALQPVGVASLTLGVPVYFQVLLRANRKRATRPFASSEDAEEAAKAEKQRKRNRRKAKLRALALAAAREEGIYLTDELDFADDAVLGIADDFAGVESFALEVVVDDQEWFVLGPYVQYVQLYEGQKASLTITAIPVVLGSLKTPTIDLRRRLDNDVFERVVVDVVMCRQTLSVVTRS